MTTEELQSMLNSADTTDLLYDYIHTALNIAYYKGFINGIEFSKKRNEAED